MLSLLHAALSMYGEFYHPIASCDSVVYAGHTIFMENLLAYSVPITGQISSPFCEEEFFGGSKDGEKDEKTRDSKERRVFSQKKLPVC